MGISRKALPSQSVLLELFEYNERTGVLYWRKLPLRSKHSILGSIPGRCNSRGYRRLKISGQEYQAHRVIWKMVTGNDPKESIDHINGDPSDNRFSNLREATTAQNGWNMRRPDKNRAGLKGVRFVPSDNAWRAYIGVSGRQHYLGQFKDIERAYAARRAAAQKLHGEFARIE